MKLHNLVPRLQCCEDWGTMLSGGEKQRLQIARVLLLLQLKPDLIKLIVNDNSFSAIDEELAVELFRYVQSWCPIISTSSNQTITNLHSAVYTLSRDAVG